jgi:hypothetical protein
MFVHISGVAKFNFASSVSLNTTKKKKKKEKEKEEEEENVVCLQCFFNVHDFVM